MSKIFVPLTPEAEALVEYHEKRYAALQASHEELIDALHRAVTEMKFWAKGHADAEIFIAEKALANAAKLDPTK